MEFRFETTYNANALTAMAKALRKTTREKRSRRSHIFGIVVVILALLLVLPIGGRVFVLDFRAVITLLAALAIILALIFEDRLNGYIAGKRMLPNLKTSVVTFREDGYHSQTEVGSSDFSYDSILALAETEDYFVFLFSQNHAQVYDKRTLTGGTLDEFRDFIKAAAQTPMQRI